MTHTSPTSTTAMPRDDARPPQAPQPTFGEMLEELIDLSTGVGVALLPLLLLAMPGIVLFLVLPAILLLALALPLALAGAVTAGPAYLVARRLRRRRRRTGARSARSSSNDWSSIAGTQPGASGRPNADRPR